MEIELSLEQQIADLQEKLRLKQELARQCKLERLESIRKELADKKLERTQLEHELGLEAPAERQKMSWGGARRRKKVAVGPTERCVAALKRAGKPLLAREIANLAGLEGSQASNVSVYLKIHEKAGRISRVGFIKPFKWHWTGGNNDQG